MKAKHTIKILLEAEFEGSITTLTAARKRLDQFRESVLPSQEFGITITERDANARLIAAAPELLEALQTLAAYANGKLGMNPYCIPEYKQALCAIGKATGHATDGDQWMDANNEAYTAHAAATGR